jgi:hydrogenase/urease accessory protein HupE
MLRKNWYYALLSLPIVITVLSLLHIKMLPSVTGNVPDASFSYFGAAIGASQLMVMPQYLVFYLGIWVWSRHKTVEQMRRLTWYLPLLFVPVCAVGLGIYALYKGVPFAELFNTIFGSMILFSPFIVFYGYIYVMFAHLLTWIFKKFGWIVEEHAQAR